MAIVLISYFNIDVKASIRSASIYAAAAFLWAIAHFTQMKIFSDRGFRPKIANVIINMVEFVMLAFALLLVSFGHMQTKILPFKGNELFFICVAGRLVVQP